jgi:transcriptional regulator with XRE-family HTH domain
VIITPTLVIAFALVMTLAAWAVRKDIKSKRENKKNSPEEICKRIGVPLELYLEYERDSSLAISELIRIFSIKNTDPQKIEYLKLLKEEKVRQEEERQRISDQVAAREAEEVASPAQIAAYERFTEKVYALLGLLAGFTICFLIISATLYALTLVIPAMVFSWTFVFIATCLVLFLLALASYFR